MNFFLLFSQSFLLSAKSFLLFAEFFLLLFQNMNGGEEVHRAFNGGLVANHIGLSFVSEPYEVALNFFLQIFNELGRVIRAEAFAVSGNADVCFSRGNHKLVSIAFAIQNNNRGTGLRTFGHARASLRIEIAKRLNHWRRGALRTYQYRWRE